MIIKEGLVNGVYYEHNKAVGYKGLIEVEGNFYYVNDHGKVLKDRKYYVTKTNDLYFEDGTPVKKGYYYFDAEGKMIID